MPIIKCFNRKCCSFNEEAVDHCINPLFGMTQCPDVIIKYDRPPVNDYARALASNECACGNDKKPRYVFCLRCYKSLPSEIRRELWRRLNIGFDNAYEEAVKYLEENVW